MARKVIPLKHDIARTESPRHSPVKNPTELVQPPRRYAVINEPLPTSRSRNSSPRKPSMPKSPPLVRSARELAREREVELEREKTREFEKAEGFTMYEAVPFGEENLNGKGVMLDEDPEMVSFNSMLQEYLRGKLSVAMVFVILNEYEVNDINLTDESNGNLPGRIVGPQRDDSDDYVWDVFIHRTIPLDTWNQVALLGSV